MSTTDLHSTSPSEIGQGSILLISASVSRFGRGDATEESTGTRSIFERLLETDPDQPSFEEFLTKVVIFGALMLYFWLCDYQHIW